MTQNDDALRKDINELKSEIITLKASFNKLIVILRINIPDLQEIIPITESNESRKTSISIINYSSIQSHKIKELINSCNKNLSSCKENGLFIEFCSSIAGLIEDVIRFFLRRKFRELQNGNNEDLLEACSLLERDTSKPWKMPKLYISRNDVIRFRQQFGDEDDTYHPDGDKYLSLSSLEKAPSIFMFELCFILLFRDNFHQQKKDFSYSGYMKIMKNNRQIISAATQRQPRKLANSSSNLNMEYYYRLNNVRKFRNIYEHNKNNKSKQEEEIRELKDYIKIDLDNYDGIIKAVQWLLFQLDYP
ncbi:hypothetical protein H6F96_22255 [Microcoleus sp. FACHB-53]|nr:hypothetical protein [Microcoleus sp. FACHB-53]